MNNLCRTCMHMQNINNYTAPACKIGKYKEGITYCEHYEEEMSWAEKQLQPAKATIKVLALSYIGLMLIKDYFPGINYRLQRGLALKILQEIHAKYKVLPILAGILDNIDFFDEFEAIDD